MDNFQAEIKPSQPGLIDFFRQIQDGKILLIPFDTVWGLAGDARKRGVVEKIFKIKGRDSSQPVSVLLPRLDYFGINTLSGKYSIKTGPYTSLIKIDFKPKLAPLCYQKKNNQYIVGVRHISPQYQIQKICRQLDIPLTATSANRTGEREVRNLAEAKKFYRQIPDELKKEVILADTKEKTSGQPSLIIDLDGGQKISRI